MTRMSPQEQLARLKKGASEIISEVDLLNKLEKSHKLDLPLRVKVGCDPSRPDLHLGHTVLLNKARQFQSLGHEVLFLIGDFTAMIGDPTGRNEARPPLSQEEITAHAQTYAKQVFKVLDKDKTKIVYNSTWMNKFTPADFVRLTSQYTVARMLERDDFEKRYLAHQPIHLHELLYPLVQGYDSVELKSDVELGGTDQKFNMLVGRELQRTSGQPPQCVLTVPILEGLDGVQKMSKSFDNYIALEDSPREMFGKTMRISDELMFRYYELLTDLEAPAVEELKRGVREGKVHPKEAKVNLAMTLVERFHSKDDAEKAREEFERVFAQKGLPDSIPEYHLKVGSKLSIIQLMLQSGMAESLGAARRLIDGRAVEWNHVKVDTHIFPIEVTQGAEFLLKVGKKRFLKVKGAS